MFNFSREEGALDLWPGWLRKLCHGANKSQPPLVTYQSVVCGTRLRHKGIACNAPGNRVKSSEDVIGRQGLLARLRTFSVSLVDVGRNFLEHSRYLSTGVVVHNCE